MVTLKKKKKKKKKKEMVTLKEDSKMFQQERFSELNVHQFLHVWYLVRTEFHICK